MMKPHAPSLLAFAILSALPLPAQTAADTPDAPPSAAASGSCPRQGGCNRPPHRPNALSEGEHQQLKAAHDQAVQQNPSLEQALQEARQAMEKAKKDLDDAMIAIDPSVAPILAKMHPPRLEGAPGNRPPGSAPTDAPEPKDGPAAPAP